MVDPPIVTDIGAFSDCWYDGTIVGDIGASSGCWYEGTIVGDKCTSTALVCVEVLGITPDEDDCSSILLSIGTETFLLVGALLPFRPLPLGMSAVANLVMLGVFLIAPYDAINESRRLLCYAAATT